MCRTKWRRTASIPFLSVESEGFYDVIMEAREIPHGSCSDELLQISVQDGGSIIGRSRAKSR
jgi:hypothetical protein